MRIYTFLLLLILVSCQNRENIEGKYINSYSKNIEHYLILNKDNTFIHYFKDKNKKELINKGLWFKTNSKELEIKLTPWIDYGDYIYEKLKCNKCIRFVKLRNNELIFSYDLADEMNFVKFENK